MPPKRRMVQASSSESAVKRRSKDTAIATSNAVKTYQYRYSPVDSKNGQIRLLTIRPGRFSSPLEVTLDTTYQLSRYRSANLSDPQAPAASRFSRRSFDALSYSWGPQADPAVLAVGCGDNSLLSITRNLAIALPHLRRPDRDRVVWIDALCIDQSSFEERALQVRLMADIYKEAKTVVCWVGPASEDSKLAIRAIRELNLRVDVRLEEDIAKPRGETNAQWANISVPLPFDSDIMRAVSNLFNRSWFERLWIYQEARLGGERAVLQCGHSRIEWQKVVQANWCFRFKPWKDEVSAEFRRRMGIVDRMHYPNPTNLALLIRRTIYLQCSDPRDRVYAMMSTTRKEEQDMQIQVDYKKPAGKVYQDYVQQFVGNFKSLRLLSFCEMQDHSGEMPTWVPDWSHPPCTNAPRASRYASGYMKSDVVSISEDVLKVTGVRVGTVRQCTAIDIGDGSDAQAIQLIRDSAPQGVLRSVHPECVPMLEAYCCTLCFDVFSCRTTPERTIFPSFTQSLWLVETILNPSCMVPAIPRKSEANKYLRYVVEACKGRSLIFTTSGHIGLAPAGSKPGDHVYLLPGCRELIVLRSCLSHPGFQVIGHAYVHGMNDGEPIFGQLPRHYDVKLRCEDGVLKNLLFRNIKNGSLEERDPRFSNFSEEEMTEGLWIGKAPKINALKAREVTFETVALL